MSMYCSMVVIHISLMQRLFHSQRHAEQARRPHWTKGVLQYITWLWIYWGLTFNTNCSFCVFKVCCHYHDVFLKDCCPSIWPPPSNFPFSPQSIIISSTAALSIFHFYPCCTKSLVAVPCALSPLLIVTLLRLQWAGGSALILDTLMLIWSCSQGLRVALIVLVLTLTSRLIYPPHHSVCPLHLLLLSLFLSCPAHRFLPMSTNSFPLTRLLPSFPISFPISKQRWSRVMEMSHVVLWFLAVWWQPVPSPVLFDSHWSCLAAACLFSGLAGPAQPASPYDDHWLTYSTTCLVLSDWLTSAT